MRTFIGMNGAHDFVDAMESIAEKIGFCNAQICVEVEGGRQNIRIGVTNDQHDEVHFFRHQPITRPQLVEQVAKAFIDDSGIDL